MKRKQATMSARMAMEAHSEWAPGRPLFAVSVYKETGKKGRRKKAPATFFIAFTSSKGHRGAIEWPSAGRGSKEFEALTTAFQRLLAEEQQKLQRRNRRLDPKQRARLRRTLDRGRSK